MWRRGIVEVCVSSACFVGVLMMQTVMLLGISGSEV